MENELTDLEKSRFFHLEEIIEKGQETFIEVGSALMEIRDSGLYRYFGTFGHYCKERWGFTANYARRLIDSSTVIKNIGNVPTGTIPTSERQTRPLTQLPPDQQREVWEEAVETAPEGKVTAKHVEEVVQGITLGPKYSKRQPPSNGMQFVRMAIMDLEKITDDDSEREQAFATIKQWIKEHERRN